MTRRRNTFVARHQRRVDPDPIEIGLFIAGSLLVAVILASVILGMAARYMA